MNCPNDGERLSETTIAGVNVSECPQCKGMWFERGEFAQAVDASEPDLRWLDFDLWSDQRSFEFQWSERNCPICEERLITLRYGDPGVKLDYCKEKHGLWLDKGEFPALIAALEEEANRKSALQYLGASLAEARELVTGSEGLVSEWRDFASVVRLLQYRLLAEHPRLAEFLTAFQSANPLK